jgi:hypothetical protein
MLREAKRQKSIRAKVHKVYGKSRKSRINGGAGPILQKSESFRILYGNHIYIVGKKI